MSLSAIGGCLPRLPVTAGISLLVVLFGAAKDRDHKIDRKLRVSLRKGEATQRVIIDNIVWGTAGVC